ncbi:MAG: hypothetical protein AAFQ44_00980 [Pseudomonadota bacterium]
MTRERLYLFDTTLRDGAQTTGVDFSVSDKRRIADVLDGLGIDYIEGGYPGANATDTEFFDARPTLETSRFVAFGMTKRAGRSAANDPGLQASVNANADAVCLVAKAWDYHVRVALGSDNEEHISGVRQSVEAIVGTGARRSLMRNIFSMAMRRTPAMRWRRCMRPLMRARGGLRCAIPTAERCPRNRTHCSRRGRVFARKSPWHSCAQ